MTRTTLHDGWSLRPLAGPVPPGLPSTIPATVPGTVHTDLMAAGVIPDPYLDGNEAQVQWIGECDFGYCTNFAFTGQGHERVDLVAEGLDTVATVTVNGIVLGRTQNQHRSYRFDVRGALRPVGNELSVDFGSALVFARAEEARIGARPIVGNDLPYNAIRKMACNFGWDWGPVLVTAGIWKPIYLEAWSTARIASVVPLVTVDRSDDGSADGQVELRIELERTSDVPLRLEAVLTGPDGFELTQSTEVASASAVMTLRIATPSLWWPRGYGEQPLYRVEVRVSTPGGVLDRWSHDIGFRTVEIDAVPDEFGTPFAFRINGEYVWIKGANWIPDDCFLPRVSRECYQAGITDAVEADMNMLRIWGGGIFESDDLYDICNREGILVWQDFLFACAAYSEDDELWREVDAEARENVARLAGHPSLVIYNGSNENVEGYYNWGWKDVLEPQETWGRGYYDRLLPGILAEIDPTRPYLPSSPFSPQNYATPTDPNHGPVHSWKVWGSLDYTHYRDAVPRFVAEFGFQGPPNYSTLTRAVHDRPLRPDSPGVLSHQKAKDGNAHLRRGYLPHLPEPDSFDGWHFTTQLNQARAVTYGIEHFRSHSPRTAGSIIWQLNDCWPVTSWAAVDGDRRRKPLWYALRHVNAPHLLMLQPHDGHTVLVAGNDTGKPWTETVAIRRLTLGGVELASQEIRLEVAPRSNTTVVLQSSVSDPREPGAEVIVASAGSARRAYWYFVEDLALDAPPLEILTDIRRTDRGYEISVRAKAFVKDLILNPDRLDPAATVDDMLITLLPGEVHRFQVRTSLELEHAALVSRPVLGSVNQLIHPGARTS